MMCRKAHTASLKSPMAVAHHHDRAEGVRLAGRRLLICIAPNTMN